MHNMPNQTWQTYLGPGWKSLICFFLFFPKAFYLCFIFILVYYFWLCQAVCNVLVP